MNISLRLCAVLCTLSAGCLTTAVAQTAAPAAPYSSYLFAFFSNNSPQGEQIRYAVSDDGFNYTSLNEGRPVVASDSIALKKSIRDPHITRAQDGKTFYMVLTDMRSDEGWQSNDGLILMKSTDLIHWQHTAIDFPTRFPNLPGFDRKNLHAVWAPQTLWDEEAGRYLIYYSIGRHDWEYAVGDRFQPHFKLFYSYANADFTDITEPRLLFDFGTAAIDGDIVYNEKEREYVLFFKDEGLSTDNRGFRTRQGVMRATSRRPTGPYTVEYRHLNKADEFPVEGSSVFRLLGTDTYVLMYDCYAKGYYQFCQSQDLKTFSFVQNTRTQGDFTPRHGSVMPITQAERERLEAWSELNIVMRRVSERPVPTFTLSGLKQRDALLTEAQHVLRAPAETRVLQRLTKRLQALCP